MCDAVFAKTARPQLRRISSVWSCTGWKWRCFSRQVYSSSLWCHPKI